MELQSTENKRSNVSRDIIEIGKRIALARKTIEKLHGIKREQFAQTMGVSSRTLTNYETGQKGPGIEFILLLCGLYGLNIRWLVYGIDEMFDPKPSPTGIAEAVRMMSVEDALKSQELVGQIILFKVREMLMDKNFGTSS